MKNSQNLAFEDCVMSIAKVIPLGLMSLEIGSRRSENYRECLYLCEVCYTARIANTPSLEIQ